MAHQHFTKDDRNELAILLKKGVTQKDIAFALGKHPSSIGREIKRNSVKGEYLSHKAQHKALVSRAKSKYQNMKIEEHNEFRNYLIEHIQEYWTPEEIAGRWNKKQKTKRFFNSNFEPVFFSAPTIYKWLYSNRAQHYCKFLKSKRYKIKKRKNDLNKAKKSIIPNPVSIHERPPAVAKNIVFGTFEGDTLGRIKSDKDVIAGIREKVSRYLMIKKEQGLKYAMDGFKNMLNPHQEILKSITLDRGVENVNYAILNTDVYFCDPYSSWQKGGIENDFQRLRRFIPKGSSLNDYSINDIIKFNNIMNNTPRKCLNWNTPKEVFEQLKVVSQTPPRGVSN